MGKKKTGEVCKIVFDFGKNSGDLNEIINLCISTSESIKKRDCNKTVNLILQLSGLIEKVAERSKANIDTVREYLTGFNDFRRLIEVGG